MSDQTPIAAAAPFRFDGWTPERKVRFLDHLAATGNVRAAAARVGMSREAAYRLRRRDPFVARAWDAGLVQAREASAEELASRALDGVEEDVWFRGEVVGTRRKYDSRLLLAHMARLDKFAEENAQACEDVYRFDELLACVAGEELPAAIDVGEALPPRRDETIELAGQAVTEALEDNAEERSDDEYFAEFDRAHAEAAVTWDGWFARACGTVDRLLEGDRAKPEDPVRTVSEASTSTAEAATEGAETTAQDAVAVVAEVSPSPADVAGEAPATPAGAKPERGPRFEDFARSPTSWRDYCEARKAFHQKQLAERRAQRS